MIIQNVKVYSENQTFIPGEICIDDGKIADIRVLQNCDNRNQEVVDGEGCYAIPGLVDIHFHGCMGYDICDDSAEAYEKIAAYELTRGITSICPATMTLSENDLLRIMKNAADYKGHEGAMLVGINMEGPFISKEKKGAQSECYVRTCDKTMFRKLQESANGLIKLVDIAPEIEGAMEFIEEFKNEVTISLAHTTASYDTAKEAFNRGVKQVTHLFNAMPPFLHREPGVVGAAYDAKEVSVEMICDGVHIHPAVVRASFDMFGAHRIIFVSDSMRATGLTDGRYTLGGQEVYVNGKCATLKNGTLAGSVTDLMGCVKIAVQEMGIPLVNAVRCATENPARAIGIYDSCGSITPGKQADLVLLDSMLDIKAVYKSGKPVIL